MKIKSRNELKRLNPSLHWALVKRGLLNNVFSSYVRYSLDDIKKEALKHKTKNELRRANESIYNKACKLNILDEVCKHMIQFIHKKWTKDMVISEMVKYKNISDFARNLPGAYRYSIRNNMNEAKEFFDNKLLVNKIDLIKKEALKHKTRSAFAKSSSNLYLQARKLNILDEVCKHMKKVK